MKDCFEYGTPETLPFLIAHAFITVVSNVSIAFQLFHLNTKKKRNLKSARTLWDWGGIKRLWIFHVGNEVYSCRAFHYPNPLHLLAAHRQFSKLYLDRKIVTAPKDTSKNVVRGHYCPWNCAMEVVLVSSGYFNFLAFPYEAQRKSLWISFLFNFLWFYTIIHICSLEVIIFFPLSFRMHILHHFCILKSQGFLTGRMMNWF